VNEAETKLEKIAKLISENATLQEKFQESESLKRKYQERYMLNEERIKALNDNLKTQQEMANSFKKQLNDIKALKSHNHKIYDEKFSSLSSECEKLKRENEILRKKLSNNQTLLKQSDQEEQIIFERVEAKPFLFGPIDTGKY
jgi:hypothetical protein